ncbi:MAG: phosphatidylglycerophosphatase A [Thiomicrospira sp.]|uniref:phosphatidylglycerophosphatase A family protein n=1 Tax=Thiomicrospira sp. TaxID=935 RepID=UPI001A020D82|nr:phosphatidylglycerophosphatase A [Thiomicrospira sp.]MBE0493781.1 phosphatidylglycerophosphatase A [Thiomicrospira sp.]
MTNPTWSDLLKNPALMLGFGFGSGLSPKAPGTVGTLLGAALFIPLIIYSIELAWVVFGLALLAGSWICGRSAELVGVHDHGGIVWDEFVGIWLVLLLLPTQAWTGDHQAWWWLAAFAVFRFFDIVKPWPIRWVDAKVSGGFGILLDDLLAAVFSLIGIWVIYMSILV